MVTPVIIIGAGGHAKVLRSAIQDPRFTVLGFTDADVRKAGATILETPIVGGDEVIAQYKPGQVLLVNGIGSTSSTNYRRQVFIRFREQGYSFYQVIHPSAVIAGDAAIKASAQIMAGAILQPGVRIGENVIINTRASLDHDCLIEDHVHIAPGAVLSGGVHVKEGTHIGTGAIIIQGITIGKNCLVGAGTVVVADIPDGTTVVGVPGRVVRT